MVLIFLDAIYYPHRENKNLKLLLNVTSHVFIISQFKKNHLFIFCFFIISVQVFQCSYGIFMQTRTCSYKPRSMLQPMPGTHKMLQNLNLISCKSQFLVFPTMCVFHLLGIHLSERTAMTRVSLSAGSNCTDLR